jgi:hypothetical protein
MRASPVYEQKFDVASIKKTKHHTAFGLGGATGRLWGASAVSGYDSIISSRAPVGLTRTRRAGNGNPPILTPT